MVDYADATLKDDTSPQRESLLDWMSMLRLALVVLLLNVSLSSSALADSRQVDAALATLRQVLLGPEFSQVTGRADRVSRIEGDQIVVTIDPTLPPSIANAYEDLITATSSYIGKRISFAEVGAAKAQISVRYISGEEFLKLIAANTSAPTALSETNDFVAIQEACLWNVSYSPADLQIVEATILVRKGRLLEARRCLLVGTMRVLGVRGESRNLLLSSLVNEDASGGLMEGDFWALSLLYSPFVESGMSWNEVSEELKQHHANVLSGSDFILPDSDSTMARDWEKVVANLSSTLGNQRTEAAVSLAEAALSTVDGTDHLDDRGIITYTLAAMAKTYSDPEAAFGYLQLVLDGHRINKRQFADYRAHALVTKTYLSCLFNVADNDVAHQAAEAISLAQSLGMHSISIGLPFQLALCQLDRAIAKNDPSQEGPLALAFRNIKVARESVVAAGGEANDFWNIEAMEAHVLSQMEGVSEDALLAAYSRAIIARNKARDTDTGYDRYDLTDVRQSALLDLSYYSTLRMLGRNREAEDMAQSIRDNPVSKTVLSADELSSLTQ